MPTINLMINGDTYCFILDTGSCINCITLDFYENIHKSTNKIGLISISAVDCTEQYFDLVEIPYLIDGKKGFKNLLLFLSIHLL